MAAASVICRLTDIFDEPADRGIPGIPGIPGSDAAVEPQEQQEERHSVAAAAKPDHGKDMADLDAFIDDEIAARMGRVPWA